MFSRNSDGTTDIVSYFLDEYNLLQRSWVTYISTEIRIYIIYIYYKYIFTVATVYTQSTYQNRHQNKYSFLKIVSTYGKNNKKLKN